MSLTDTSPADTGSYDQISAEAARRAAADFTEAFTSHDTERVLALVDPQVHWENPLAHGGRLHGTAAVRTYVDGLWRTFPDIVFALDGEVHLALDGRSTSYVWTATATMTGPLVPPGFAPTGRRIEAVGADVHKYRDGRVVQWQTFTDLTALGRQIGAAPAPHGAGEKAAVLLQRLVAARMRRAARG